MPRTNAEDVGPNGGALATSKFPVTVLGQRTITLHLTPGVTATAPGFKWLSAKPHDRAPPNSRH